MRNSERRGGFGKNVIRIGSVVALVGLGTGVFSGGSDSSVDAAGRVPAVLTRTYGGDFGQGVGCSVESVLGGDDTQMRWVVERTGKANPNGSQRIDVTGWGTLPEAERACEESGLPGNRENDRVMDGREEETVREDVIGCNCEDTFVTADDRTYGIAAGGFRLQPQCLCGEEVTESKTRIVFRTMVVDQEGRGLGSSRSRNEVTIPVPEALGEGSWEVARGGVVPTGESIMVTVDVVSRDGGDRVPVASGVSGMASSVKGLTLLNIPADMVFSAWNRGDLVVMALARRGYETRRIELTRDMVSEPEEGLGGDIAGMIEGISVVTMERN